MIRLAFLCAIVVAVFFSYTQAVHMEEVVVLHSKNDKVIKDVFVIDPNKSKAKHHSRGMVHVTFKARKKSHKHIQKLLRHRHHQRRQCCEVGNLAGKAGMSCDIRRNYIDQFFNQVTRMRMKYQDTRDKNGKPRSRFRFHRNRHLYNRIKKCIGKKQLKSAVRKCCVAYVNKHRGSRKFWWG